MHTEKAYVISEKFSQNFNFTIGIINLPLLEACRKKQQSQSVASAVADNRRAGLSTIETVCKNCLQLVQYSLELHIQDSDFLPINKHQHFL